MEEIESKIFDALIELGLKSSKVLENKNHESHFITLIKINNKYQNNPSLKCFFRSPVSKKSANESQNKTFILRPEISGRRIIADKSLFHYENFDSPLFPLN